MQKKKPTLAATPPVDRDAITPIDGSYADFRMHALGMARELAAHRGTLDERGTLLTLALVKRLDALIAEAETLALEFAGWPEQPPDVLARSTSIQRLMALREQVRSYVDGDR